MCHFGGGGGAGALGRRLSLLCAGLVKWIHPSCMAPSALSIEPSPNTLPRTASEHVPTLAPPPPIIEGMLPRTVHRTAEIFAVLRDREVRAIWISEWISDAGSFVTFIALAVYIHSLTPGVAAVGFALGLRSIAGFLFGPFTGVLADRLDRRRVMIVCDLARAGLVAALPFTHVVWEAYALAFASAILSPLFRASRAALLPQVAPGPKLVPALTVAETTHHVLHTVGPALGGLVVDALGVAPLFWIGGGLLALAGGLGLALLGRHDFRGAPIGA